MYFQDVDEIVRVRGRVTGVAGTGQDLLDLREVEDYLDVLEQQHRPRVSLSAVRRPTGNGIEQHVPMRGSLELYMLPTIHAPV